MKNYEQKYEHYWNCTYIYCKNGRHDIWGKVVYNQYLMIK